MFKVMKIGYKILVRLYYTSLMTYLVFTFADSLLRGLINSMCVELLLYTIMWLFLVLQATFAYVHIERVEEEDYTIKALISDSIDIGIAIYVCAAIGSTYSANTYSELTHYQHLSVPFLILAINQFSWFVIVKEFNVPAIFRISILFCGMLAVTLSETLYHSIWNLVAVVVLIVLLGILRAVDKAPGSFKGFADKLWKYVNIEKRIK